MTLAEELYLLGQFMLKYLPPKMQRMFLQKCSHFVKVDYEDPFIYVMVDENQYLQKIVSSSAANSERD